MSCNQPPRTVNTNSSSPAERLARSLFSVTCVFLLLAATNARAAGLLGSDAIQSDWFGRSVSQSGKMALVLAPKHELSDLENWGVAYLFKDVVNATGVITEGLQLVIRDTSFYGGVHADSAVLSGNRAMLVDSGAGANGGAAYLFTDLVGNSGKKHEYAKLIPSEQYYADWEFGGGASLSMTTALLGAGGAGVNDDRPGCVFLYRNLHTRSGTLFEDATLRRSDATGRADGFGYFLHHDDDIAIVGHPSSDDGTQPAGSAYLYLNLHGVSGSNVTERAKLLASDRANGDYFGSAVSVSGTTGLVSAPGRPAAYVFRNLDDALPPSVTENLKLIASDGAPGGFGLSVSLSGKTAIIGAPYDLFSRGSAYIYRDVSTGTGTTVESLKVLASDYAEVEDEFGYSVSIDGDQFLVGAYLKDSPDDLNGDGDYDRHVGKAYTGSVSSMTILNTGKMSKNISGLSFISRDDWIIGQTTDANRVTVFPSDKAEVMAAAIYIGQNPGSDHNLLHIRGTLVADVVHIGSVNGNANNTLRFDTGATFEATAFRVAPANTLGFQGNNTSINAILARLGNTQLQVLSEGRWTTVDENNYADLVTITAHHTGFTHINPKVTPPSTADSDSDGLPDHWETRYFGSGTAANPSDDSDGDGKTNREEYLAATSPTDGTSVFSIQEAARNGSSLAITFEAAPGKAYEIRSGTTLTGGFPTVEQTVAATPTGGIETVTVNASAPAKFYRVVVMP
jgi:hypothetical protein